MSLRAIRRQVGRLAMAGFGGPAVPAELRSLAREFDLGGIVLFRRNVEAPDQVADLAREAQGLGRERPVWVSVDQEGGRVARLGAPFTVWPPMRALGRSGDERLAERFARALASELRAVGISLDYAPVLDVLTRAANPAIGDRALAGDAGTVARLGRVIVRTLQAGGIAACGKHFPGHGDATVDSHLEVPLIDHPPDRLDAVELVPFRAAIAEDVAGIMMGHLLVPALDSERPASLSRAVTSGLLRERLGYDGLVFTDDLEMGAIRQTCTVPEAAVRALAAGSDILLLGGASQDTQWQSLEAVVRALESEELPVARVEEALRRQQRATERFLAPGVASRPLEPARLRALLGRPEHQAIAEEMAGYL